MTDLHVDFNEFFGDGDRTLAALVPEDNTLEIGQPVHVRDGDGNRCEGEIIDLDHRLAYVVVDWDTWEEADG